MPSAIKTVRKAKPAAKRIRKMGRPSADFSARAQILLGAAQAFGEKGFADCAVEDVLEAAKVSRRTFYRFFRNKEEVLVELFNIATRQLIEAVTEAVTRETDLFRKLDAGVEAFLQVQQGAGPLTRVFALETMKPGSKLTTRYHETVESFARLFQREGQRMKRIEVDPLMFRGLIAAMDQISIALQTDPSNKTRVDYDRAKRVMLRILAASLALPGDPVPPLPQSG